MRILFALLSAGIGLSLLIAGYRVARFVIPLMGFLSGLSLGGAIIADAANSSFLNTALGITVGIFMGLLFAALAYFWYALAVVIMMGGLGYLIGSGLIQLLGFSPGILSATVGLALGIMGGILAVIADAPKYVLIWATSIVGAVVATGGVLLLFNKIPLDLYSYATANLTIHASLWWTMVAIVLLVMGVVTQSSLSQGYKFEEWSMDDEQAHHTPTKTTPAAGASSS